MTDGRMKMQHSFAAYSTTQGKQGQCQAQRAPLPLVRPGLRLVLQVLRERLRRRARADPGAAERPLARELLLAVLRLDLLRRQTPAPAGVLQGASEVQLVLTVF